MEMQALRLTYFGFFSHFLLPDYDQQSWQALRWIGIFCVLLLSFQRELKLNRWHLMGLCFLLCINKSITLFFLRDVLTQSFYLLLLSTLLLFYHLKRKEYQPWEEKEEDQVDPAFQCFLKPGIIYLTASVYCLAAIHKLNHDFLSSPQSCALHGVNTIVQAFHLPTVLQELGALSLFGYQITAVLVILLEIAITFLLLYQKSTVLLLAIPFHLPLTLTIAPAFGLIMLGGLAMSLKREEFQAIGLAVYQPYLSAIYLLLLLTIFLLKGSFPQWLELLKTGLYLWIWLGVCWIKLCSPPLTQGTQGNQNQGLTTNGKLIPALIFSVHGLLFPYLGIEVQHSSAMLSNLRIEGKCHNSLIFPNLGIDPYYYLDQVQFADYQEGEPYQRAQKLRKTLWHWAAFYTMKQNWCGSHLEPIALKGHHQQGSFDIKNLCDEQDFQLLQQQLKLRFWDLNQWQRFQKNLSIDCHDACVH